MFTKKNTQVVGYAFSELVTGVRVFLCLKLTLVYYLCPILYSQFKKAQEIFEPKRKELTNWADIQGGRAALRNLGSKLDEEALKQQEILYTKGRQLPIW